MILMKRKGRRVQKPQLDAEPFVGRQQVAGQHRVGGCGVLHHQVEVEDDWELLDADDLVEGEGELLGH